MLKTAVLKILFIFSFVLLGNTSIWAQNFSANVSKNPVEVGERFTLSFVLQDSKGKITPPPLTDFRVIFGPSQSSNFSYINGKTSRTVTVSYVLMAENAGTFTIGSSKAETDEGTFSSNPIKITVKEGSNTATATAPTQQSPKTQQVKTESSGNIIMQVTASKNKAYIGEAVELTYTLYSRYTQLELGETEYPSISGFWVETIDLGSVQWASEYATINGMRYRKAVIKKQLLYPQRAGKQKIPSFQQNVMVNRSFFNQGTKVSCQSNQVNIEVLPYPNNAPADFGNIAGLFRISSEISSNDVQVNEAITFKVKISGEGNLKLINAPEIKFPNDFEVYEPKTNDRFAVKSSGIKGSREWEYIIIPRYPGKYQIPEISFSYFNTSTKKYKTAKTQLTEINVSGTANQSGPVVSSKSDVTLLNKDIRFIEKEWQEGSSTVFYAGKFTFWLIAILMVLVGLGASYMVKKNQALKENQIVYKQKKASKLATKHLAKAQSLLKKQESTAFYISIVDAIHGFIQDKFTLDKTSLARAPLKEFLVQKGATEAQFNELQTLIDDCDMARYAPSADVNMEGTYERAKNTLQWLEKLSA